MSTSDNSYSTRQSAFKTVGLIAGPVAAALVYLVLPDSYTDSSGSIVALGPAARSAASLAAWMALWWMTEAVSVYATALIPLALFPLTGVADIATTAREYGSPIVFLFLGGFMLALAIEKWGLHRRLALTVLAAVGTRPAAIVGAFMAVSAGLSMWVTNTATTLMLLPVALSIIRLLPDTAEGQGSQPFAMALLLGIAYAASIGGMGTIVGTAPNVFLVSFVAEQQGRNIGFVEWMIASVPLVVVLVPLVWWLLTRWLYCLPARDLDAAGDLLRRERDALPPFGTPEKRTLAIFALTAAAWVLRPLLNEWSIAGIQPLDGLTDAGIAMLAALVLFIVPADMGQRTFLLDWHTAARLPWGLLILFGGGLALAASLSDSGFSEFLAAQAGALQGLPLWIVITVVTALVVFLTELTSNTATTATLVPVFFAVALGLGEAPLALIVPATFAASCAFMLPVATPPNAIVFGSDLISIVQMSRAGLWMNLAAIMLIPLLCWVWILPRLGVAL